MIPSGDKVSGDQPSEMQLAGRLALSVAGFFLLTLAYKYLKSRVPQSGAERGEGGNGAEPKGGRAHEGAGGEVALGRGLRHRQVERKEGNAEEVPCNPPMHLVGPMGTGKPGTPSTPVSWELDQAREEQKTEEVQEGASKTGHLGAGLQPSGKCLEEEVKEPGGAIPSNDANARSARDPGATLEERQPVSPSLCCREDAFAHSYEGSGKNEGAGTAELPLASRDGEGGQEAPRATREQEPPLGTGKGRPRREGASRPAARTRVGRERIPVYQATSKMGLAIDQNHVCSHEAYVFSSVAQVQVEESVLGEQASKESSRGRAELPERSLRGKVYDYYVQSESQLILKEKAAPTPLSGQPYPHRSTVPMPSGAGEQAARVLEGEPQAGRIPPKEAPDLSPRPVLLPTQDDAKSKEEALDQKEVPVQAISSKKPPGPRGGLCRQDSFQRILENPDLQVSMKGSSSPSASRSAERFVPPFSPPRSPSASSLQGAPRDVGQDAVVELVAGANFFHLPLSPESSVEVHLDLGNCYEVLCAAKKQKLESLREAAYKVMSDNYLQVLRTRAIYDRLNAMERDLILRRRMQGKKYVTVADVSSQDHSPRASRLCYYDAREDTWHLLSYMPLETVSRGCAVCSMFNYLFVAAGCEGRGKFQKPSNRVFCYNPLTDIWREIAPLNQARPHCKLVALDDGLYAIGGECLYTVEWYDPRADRWSFVAPLPNDTFAVAHTATACDGEIYVTGGTLRYMLLRYVRRSNTWTVSLTGACKDRTTDMVTANGFIYRFDLNRSTGISAYRCGTKAKLWYECASHPIPFPACFQCTVVDNLVHCISRQLHLRFLADYVSPRFGTKELQPFPSPRGALFPITLVLPDRTMAQTRV